MVDISSTDPNDSERDYSLVRLTALMPPPAAGGDEIDWEALRVRNRTFPADYRGFMRKYGGGCIDDNLWINSPPVPESIARMRYLDPWTIELSEDSDGPGEETRVLAFGQGLDGEQVFWECVSPDPDRWTLIAFRRQHGPYEPSWVRYDMGIVEFLTRLIEGTVGNPLAAAGVPKNPAEYINWRESPYRQ